MTENQKLREALQDAATSLETISLLAGKSVHPNGDLTGMGTFADVRGYATSRAGAARQALALPTAEQVDDINVAESFTSVTKTAAPVGERLTLSAEDVHAAFVKHFPKTRISQAWIGFAAEIANAVAARAALSAGDAVDAQRTPLTVLQYNAIPELCAIPPSLYESVVRAIERAHGIDAAMRKEKP